jgi:hypothetical protein
MKVSMKCTNFFWDFDYSELYKLFLFLFPSIRISSIDVLAS